MPAKRWITTPIKRLLRAAGYEVHKHVPERHPSLYPADFDAQDIEDAISVKPYTMTSPERVYCLVRAVEYIVDQKIPGDIVECGVWKGGSMMAIARTLLRKGDTSRNLYLFDTFEGMSTPTEADVAFDGEVAAITYGKKEERDGAADFTNVSLDQVKKNLASVGYPQDKIYFIVGKVEDTLPGSAPQCISLLRLDTDWYESTLHELTHLYPRLSRGGVIIIDDYGHWLGARKATDEYLERNKIPLLLGRMDYTGRLGVKI